VINSKSGLSSAPAGYRFPREVIGVALRWYLRYGLSYRDVEELLAEGGIEVDHVTIYRWVQTFTPGCSERRDATAARAFFIRAMTFGPAPVEVTTDRAPVYPRVIDELAPHARHVLEQYANNVVEADHGRLKARLRPRRGLKRIQSAGTVAAGHAFLQNLRRGHYEFTIDLLVHNRVRDAFTELAHFL
jgi:transposase, IS6 family